MNNEINPIVDFSRFVGTTTEEWKIYDGPKTEVMLQRDQFLEELAKQYNSGVRGFASLYEKYPKVRIGLRRALLYLNKKGKLKLEE